MKTKIITDDIPAAAGIIKRGGLVAVPTETVYGLAANGFDAKAVEKIYEVKGRPENKPLSLMVYDAGAMDELCEEVPDAARFLAECFWPGPLTIVLKAKNTVPEIVRAGGETVGLRCPKQEQTLELIKNAQLPLAAPSANPSGGKSPLSAREVLDYFDGKIDAVIDGGTCENGFESTIIDMSRTPYIILRQGALPEKDIDMALNASLTIIGITGGTGCGKTTALDVITELGGLVIDCDEVYHDLLLNCGPMREEINRQFPNALTDGSDDTKTLGEIVFNDPEALRALGVITHRYVGEEMNRRLNVWARQGKTLAAIDAIALVESGIGSFCRATVGITAPTQLRIDRLVQREGISREYARLRIEAQKPNEYFIDACDYTLENDDGRDAFAEKCRKLFNSIIRRD
jgi:tRNA threonylcarbamoyl adenosine modification protein (Sua5/YciO/YrdC/YwlC family)/dephospho-CoA kinase